MTSSLWKKVLIVAIALPLAGAIVAGGPLSNGQEKAKKVEKAKGRLPAYYADVVSEEQREKIYAVQAKFADKIKDLQTQLEAVEKEQTDAIEKLLTAEQKEKIDKARAEAVAKKKKKAKTETAAPPAADAKPK